VDYHWDTCRDYTSDELDAYLNNSVLVRGEDYLVDFKPPSPSSSSSLYDVEGKELDNPYPREWEPLPLLPSLPLFTLLQVAVYPSSRGLLLELAQLLCPTDSDYDNFITHKVKYRERMNFYRKKLKDKDSHLRHSKHTDRTTNGHFSAAADPKLSKSWRGCCCLTSSSWHRSGLERRGDGTHKETDTTKRRESESTSRNGDAADHSNNDGPVDAGCDVGDDDDDDDAGGDAGDEASNNLFKQSSIDRKVVGVITSGQQPHTNSNSFAVGVCSAIALNAMFRQSIGRYKHPQAHMLILFRNDRSNWIRPALLTII